MSNCMVLFGKGEKSIRALSTDSSMLLTEEDYIDNEYYAYNRLFFRLLGLWQHQTSCKQFIYVCLINLSFFIETLEQIYDLLTLEKKLISITKLLETILPTLCFGACYLNLLWNAANVLGIANYSMFIAVIQHACALFYIVEWRINERFKKDPHHFYYANNNSELAEENEWIIDVIEFYNNAVNCQIPFYSLSLKTQKLLLLLIMNSMRKCSLSLMGAIVVSHDLFAKGCKNRCWEVTTNSSMLSMGEDCIDNEYYSYNRRFFRLIGLWQSRTSFKKMIYISFINFMLAVGSSVQVYYLLTSERKLISITKLLETTLPTLCFGFCYYNLLFNDGIVHEENSLSYQMRLASSTKQTGIRDTKEKCRCQQALYNYNRKIAVAQQTEMILGEYISFIIIMFMMNTSNHNYGA
uniref:Odorant receptor n=1 Tax=Vespula pensylvanica TaxID=30213 RepID=A0A834JGM5_VESPE|nr:hypothetical protein H0235_018422 [Vespula pensylvanica]